MSETAIYQCEMCNKQSRFPEPLPDDVLCLMCSWCGGSLLSKIDPSLTVTVPREVWERIKEDNTTMYEALAGICYHGTDKPAAMGGPDPDEDVSWWKSIAHSCMRKANNALQSLATPSNADSQPTGKGE